MDSLRTSSLFHYPQKLDTLKKILAQGFKSNYCKETFTILDNPDLIVGIPMVSFCDIPLTRITNFREKYGKYAIGLSKEWGLKNGINPVFYATPNSFVLNGLREVDEIRKQKEDILNKWMSTSDYPLTTNNQNFIARPLKMSDPDCENILNSFIDNVDLFKVRSTLFGFTKSYIGKRGDEDQNNYEENEWRFVISESALTKIDWLWGEDAYENWRGDTKLKPKPPKPKSKFPPLTFDIDDVNFIILRNDKQIPSMIKYIDGLGECGGNIIADKSQKSILISKIISMDRINKDF